MLVCIIRSHTKEIGQFYMTQTEPKVFWRPKKAIEDVEKVERMKQFQEKYLDVIFVGKLETTTVAIVENKKLQLSLRS